MTSATPRKAAFYEAKYAAGDELPRSSKLFALQCLDQCGERMQVLDLGCGTGLNSGWMVERGHRVVGVDISENAIRR